MKSYIVEGGKKLHGNVQISGSKNASLPILAATILSGSVSKLYNVPNISDTKITLQILKFLGCKIKQSDDKIEIDSRYMKKYDIPESLMRKMRSTVILAGAILGRYKQVSFSYPGGCDIGARPIDLHLKAFRKMGIDIIENNSQIICKADKILAAEINLDFPSVGATENIILAATLAEGKTVISNAAMEPEIVDLVLFLKKMGARITGEGTSVIEIIGVKKLNGAKHHIMPDRIEAGTFFCAAAATSGDVQIVNVNPEHLTAVIDKMRECGCNIDTDKNSIHIIGPKRILPSEILTMPYPAFPTDMQQIFTAMLMKSNGTSVVVENIFENRFKYVRELLKMGAKISIHGNVAIIEGVKKLHSAKLECTDLRGGASMIIAGLMAKGKTKIQNIDYILRGYDNIDVKLKNLGAKIKIIEE